MTNKELREKIEDLFYKADGISCTDSNQWGWLRDDILSLIHSREVEAAERVMKAVASVPTADKNSCNGCGGYGDGDGCIIEHSETNHREHIEAARSAVESIKQEGV